MSCDVELFVATDSPITITLTDDAGTLQVSATVQLVEVLDVLANAPVAGFTPPLTLSETNPGVSGVYQGFLSDSVSLIALRKYKLKMVAVLSGGQQVTFFRETFAKEG